MKKLLLAVAMLGLVGCSTIKDWWDDLPLPPIDEIQFPVNPPIATNLPPIVNPPSTNKPVASNMTDRVNITGYKEANLKIEKTVELTKVTKSRLSWKGERDGWPKKNVKVDVNGVIFLGVIREGKVIAFGKFDWTRPNQLDKGLENVYHGYGVFSDPNKQPKTGDQVFICIIRVDGSGRTITSNPLPFP